MCLSPCIQGLFGIHGPSVPFDLVESCHLSGWLVCVRFALYVDIVYQVPSNDAQIRCILYCIAEDRRDTHRPPEASPFLLEKTTRRPTHGKEVSLSDAEAKAHTNEQKNALRDYLEKRYPREGDTGERVEIEERLIEGYRRK